MNDVQANPPVGSVSETRVEAYKPAAFIRRAAAAIVDGIVVSIVASALAKILMLANVIPDPESIRGMASNFLVSTLCGGIYAGFLYSKRGATLGKKALGLQVVDVQTRGRISFFRGFFRDTLGKLVSGLTLGIGYLMALFTADHRTLHDAIFDTRVVQPKD